MKNTLSSKKGYDCPYCNTISDEKPNILDTDILKCGSCGETFFIRIKVEIAYITSNTPFDLIKNPD